MAGESAQELARRQREKAERLLRSAERYEKGAEGEQATGAVLDTLRREGWTVFHDVHWPGRQRANLDHVVVGRAGVFVIDAKNWAGPIQVADQTFRVNGRRQDKTVAAAGDAALAVASRLEPEACAATRSVLCFVRDEPIAGWCYDVMVCSTQNLREMLLGRPPVLSEDQVRMATLQLDLAFRAASRAQQEPPARSGRRLLPARHVTRSLPPSPSHRPVRRSRRGKPGAASQLLRLGLVMLLALAMIHFLPQLSKLGDAVGKQMVTSLTPAPTSYADCAALRAAYPHGVGTRPAVRQAQLGKRAPAVETEVYRANKSLDVDHDGLACEPRKHPHG